MTKKIFLITALTTAALQVNAQWTYPNPGIISTTDVVGLGTAFPVDRLNVHDGNISLSNSNDAAERSIRGRTKDGRFRIYGNVMQADGPYLELYGNTSGQDGRINFVHTDVGRSAFEFWKTNGFTWTSQMIITNKGDVGIGDQNPIAKLTVDGDINFTPSATDHRSIKGRTGTILELFSKNSWDDGATLYLHSDNSPHEKGGIVAISSGAANDDVSFLVQNWTPGTATMNGVLKATKNGKVAIGNVSYSSNDYKLFVEKGILTEKIKVAVAGSGNWADYVFAKDYELMPLSEVEEYITENKHLPSIPSADEVVKNGLDLGQMDAKLLQKIEELTLYMIELKKENVAQAKEIESLKKNYSKKH
jgi:hypothetical protein